MWPLPEKIFKERKLGGTFWSKKSKCYHTKGPKVWAHTLDQAVEKYKHAKKAEFSFKPIFTAGTSTSYNAFECPTESHQSVESNEDGDTIQKDIEEQKREKS